MVELLKIYNLEDFTKLREDIKRKIIDIVS